MSEQPTGFTCQTCGKRHGFGVYVAAHWEDALIHTCECGAKHLLRRGRVTQTRKGKKPAELRERGPVR